MKLLKTLTISLTALLLVSCGGMQTMRSLSLGRVDHSRITRANLGGADATIGIEMNNKSKKKIIFAIGTIDILIDNAHSARVTLTDSVTIPSGNSIVELPVRITLSRNALSQIVLGALRGEQAARQNYRIRGSLEITREGEKPRKFSFNRPVSQQTIESLMAKIKL